MKKIFKKIVIVFLGLFLLFVVVGCDKPSDNGGDQNNSQNNTNQNQGNENQGNQSQGNENQGNENQGGEDLGEQVDYAASVKLDMTSSSLKQEVTVKTYVDGDTTHFHVPENLVEGGVLKARYLGINTPESTGKIEEWGKAASTFTKTKLKNATSIYIESDDENLNADSTGSRYLVWVWYKTSNDEDYRNLNIEILQEGLAIASNSANNKYGDTCVAAINQAKKFKLCVYSGQKDPDFFYGDAQELTLRELRLNIEDYNLQKVAFEGVVVKDHSQTVYVEEYDEELDMYFGMTVYYGFSASGDMLSILTVGNRVRIVGTVQFYETGGTFQVSGLSYRAMRPNDPNNIQKISEGNEAGFKQVAPSVFNGNVKIFDEEDQEEKTYKYADLAMSSSISMNNLVVKSVYTTTKEDSSSKGAMTLTCECDGVTVSVRTVVLYNNGELVTASAFEGKTINVKGIVDYFDGTYQIKLYSMNDVTFVE